MPHVSAGKKLYLNHHIVQLFYPLQLNYYECNIFDVLFNYFKYQRNLYCK